MPSLPRIKRTRPRTQAGDVQPQPEPRLQELHAHGLTHKGALIKVLGSGELTSAITIHAHKFSKSAVEKIEKAGGQAVVAGAPAAA